MSLTEDTTPKSATTSSDPESWEPFMLGDEQVGEWHPLRVDGDGSYLAAYWRVLDGHKGEFDYTVAHDKTVHVIEGKMRVAVVDGDTIELSAGDSVSLHDAQTHWEVLERPYKEIFIIS
jgi:uncharacterized protein